MATINVKDREGKIHSLKADNGLKIMEIIRDAGLDIEAACGGCCACATCHVYVDNSWYIKLDKINEDLQKVLKLFTTGLPDAGVYVLVIPPDGVAGVEGLKAAISGATNSPPGTLSHSVGFMMIGDKVSTGVLTKLLAP